MMDGTDAEKRNFVPIQKKVGSSSVVDFEGPGSAR